MSYITDVTAILEALPEDATAEEVYTATRAYSRRDVAAAMYALNSAGGGEAFNGGTITEPLVVSPDDDATPAVTIVAEDGGGAQSALLRFTWVDGTSNTMVTGEGEVVVAPQFEAGRTFSVYDANGSEALLIAGSGAIMLPNLPTSNPNSAGQIWNDAGTLKVSAG